MLLDLFESAEHEAVIVAPFMKATVVDRIVNSLSDNVRLTCVTRWNPHEIKAGVNDLSIWEIVSDVRSARLMLVPNLHAKFYRADNYYGIGSANLTNAALGWSPKPNIEIMTWGSIDATLREWESSLLLRAIQVDASLVRHLHHLVDNLPDTGLAMVDDLLAADAMGASESDQLNSSLSTWLPLTRYPEHLYVVYAGHLESQSSATVETGTNDLAALMLPKGMTEIGFRTEIAARMLQMPLIRTIDDYLREPRRFGAVRDFLSSLENYDQRRDPTTDWQTLMRWFTYFLPWRFQLSRPSHSEVIFRIE